MDPIGPVERISPEPEASPSSKMRSHKGNQPVLPQDKQCPHCSARFTRTTHLNRHMRNRMQAYMLRSFLAHSTLQTQRKTCVAKQGTARRKSCTACTESKVKCDRETPCAKCKIKGKECIYPVNKRRASRIATDTAALSSENISLPLDQLPLPNGHSAPSNFSFASPALPAPLVMLAGSSNASLAPPPPLPSQTEPFKPFFDSIFSSHNSPPSEMPSPPNPMGADAFPFATNVSSDKLYSSGQYSSGFQDMHPGRSLEAPVSNIRGSPTSSASASSSADPTRNPELDYYVHLFYAEFLKQMPIAHEATFRHEMKAPILTAVMAACGALFVRTRAAADYISKTLGEARDVLLHEFGKNSTEVVIQVHLVLAVVLLQTIGLFHQTASERTSSNFYHGMVVMMIRRASLIDKTAEWKAEIPTPLNLDRCWRALGATRNDQTCCLWLSYCHDLSHTIFFALGSSYGLDEMNAVKLPCEDRLFSAKTAGDWLLALQDSSPYGSISFRLDGAEMGAAFEAIASKDLAREPSPMPPYAHWILVHRILRRFFEFGIDISRAPGPNQSPEIFAIQYQLHNWLQSWLRGPDTPRTKDAHQTEPRYLENALPFYWLGQIAMLAFNDGFPPFTPECPTNRDHEARFRLVKRWLKQIRGWLESSDNTPTLFWDEMIEERLKQWQMEPLTEDQYAGLVTFFQSKG
ncbi:hypothetical protein DL96DRAFT_1601966 [Flagelloscypha sp. PMI_526]|nr:hypothetical protein DL96DRAFT_1601966 [Flagelloscypha sp. PMI_526]